MKKCFVMLVLLTMIGCSSNMHRTHYQVNSPTFSGKTSEPTMSQAMLDAKLHAQQDYQSGAGCIAGAGCGLFGIAGSYLYEGSIPPHRLKALEGKPETYQLLYRQEYIKETKRLRTKEAATGYVVFLGAFLVLILVASQASY